MIVDTFANRLNIAFDISHKKPTDVANETGIDKSLISNYRSGKYKAKQQNVYLLARSLNVSEAWLMGYDVPMERKNNTTDILTDGEQLLLSLFRQVPVEMQDVVLEMVRVALKNRK